MKNNFILSLIAFNFLIAISLLSCNKKDNNEPSIEEVKSEFFNNLLTKQWYSCCSQETTSTVSYNWPDYQCYYQFTDTTNQHYYQKNLNTNNVDSDYNVSVGFEFTNGKIFFFYQFAPTQKYEFIYISADHFAIKTYWGAVEHCYTNYEVSKTANPF